MPIPIKRVSAFALVLSGCTPAPTPTPVSQACDPTVEPQHELVKVRFEPNWLVLAPGQSRSVTVVVDPDYCADKRVSLSATAPSVADVPTSGEVGLHQPSFTALVTATEVGESVVSATVTTDLGEVIADLNVEVADPTLAACDGADDLAPAELTAGSVREGAGTLAGASITLPEGADAPNSGSFLWSVAPFDASVRCASDIDLPGHIALGPAVSFGPDDQRFPRDMPLSIPINLARMPEDARLRHLAVAYTGPAHATGRVVPVTDPIAERTDNGWRLSFRAPRLGTYQAVVSEQAGQGRFLRRVTHRAVIGISMGGAGAMQLGLRHHQLFDVVAAMGGPVDWTWLMDHVENNHLGGFRPIAPGTQLADIPLERAVCSDDSDCAADETCLVSEAPENDDPVIKKCTLLPPTDEPYEHASTFNTWWFEFPAGVPGHGGDFARTDHTYMFRDLALMFGNPFGDNPDLPHLPAGLDPMHPAATGQPRRRRLPRLCQTVRRPGQGPAGRALGHVPGGALRDPAGAQELLRRRVQPGRHVRRHHVLRRGTQGQRGDPARQPVVAARSLASAGG